MKTIAVFCGSSYGRHDIYKEEAKKFGELLAKNNIKLIYGGAKLGLMGKVAEGVLTNNGYAIGVMPHLLHKREISHTALSEMIMVETMHERKAKMIELADGFVMLPGGTGTLEEFFEVFTWIQIGLHDKPCGILNTYNYYDPLISFIHKLADEKFRKVS